MDQGTKKLVRCGLCVCVCVWGGVVCVSARASSFTYVFFYTL